MRIFHCVIPLLVLLLGISCKGDDMQEEYDEGSIVNSTEIIYDMGNSSEIELDFDMDNSSIEVVDLLDNAIHIINELADPNNSSEEVDDSIDSINDVYVAEVAEMLKENNDSSIEDEDDGSMEDMEKKEEDVTKIEKTPSVGSLKLGKNDMDEGESESTCPVSDSLSDMSESIMSLSAEIKSLKSALMSKCPDLMSNGTGDMDNLKAENETKLDTDDMDAKEAEKGSKEESDEQEIPTSCPDPFQPVAEGCYFFLYYPEDHKTWGGANAYCQSLGGGLSAPNRLEALKRYLKDNFSNTFWVGAKRVNKKQGTKRRFEWLDGRPLKKKDWKKGQPKRNFAHKACIYLEFFSGYKAVNYYCGEKFPFICEYTED